MRNTSKQTTIEQVNAQRENQVIEELVIKPNIQREIQSQESTVVTPQVH